ncbi:calcium-binding protein [Mesorhizobium sp. CN2-181]|uniref:calcium-binding protein n=1 Tax=Mesorhizobium yinganensis TaxID=3157707 RepID=UPI0032B7BDAF
MVLTTQHVSADSIPPGYGWSAFTPLEQIDHAAEIGGSSLIHATSSGFVWGASSEDDPGQFTLRPLSLVFEGTGLTYAGGSPNGGTITAMSIVLEGTVFGGSYPPSGPLVLEISGLSIDAATDGDLIEQALLGNIAPLAFYFGGLLWTYDGAGGSDRFDNGYRTHSLRGYDGDDVLIGGSGSDRLYGGAGDDILQGDRTQGDFGDDYLSGGAGFDIADYGTTFVVASLENPAINQNAAKGDTYNSIEGLNGSSFGDTLVGNAGANLLVGNDGNDWLRGRDGNDRLEGGEGLDRLEGGAGNDKLYGGRFDDTLIGNAGADQLHGGDQVDTASYADFHSAITASLANSALNTGGAAGDTYDSIESLIGTIGADTLYGDEGFNRLWGGVRDDLLVGGGGNDDLYGEPGDDILNGGAGADELDGGGGITESDIDTASYADAAARVVVSLMNKSNNIGDAFGDFYWSIENILGSSFGDSLAGDALDNGIDGSGGSDTLRGYGGNDVLTGGAGADSFVFSSGLDAATNVDTIIDFSIADDTVRLDDRIFAAAGAPGTLAANAFHIGAAATTTDHRIVYDVATGALSYDADGSGAGAAIRFATLSTGLALTNADFVVF